MKKALLLLIITLLFSSCATMLNDATHVVNIQSDLSDSKVKVNDSVYSLPANVVVKRSNKNLNLTLISNSKEIPFKAKPKLTGTFKYANLAGIYLYFTPYLVDLTNNKRFYYGKSLWLTSKDSTVTVLNEYDRRYKYEDSMSYYKHYIYKKGDFRINGSITLENLYKLSPGNQKTYFDTNIPGLSFGVDYFHRKNQFINATYTKIVADDVANFLFVFLSGVYEEVSSDYIRVTNNHILKRFSLGYGLSYGQTHFYRRSFIDGDSVEKRYSVFGLSFPAYYQAGRNLHLGLVYNPSFFRTNQSTQWAYEYLLSFELAWKIKL